METFLKSQLAELEAYRTHLVSPDPAAVCARLAAERGVELSLEKARELWETCRRGCLPHRTIFRTPPLPSAGPASGAIAWPA